MTEQERKAYDAGRADAEAAYREYVHIDDVLAALAGVRDYYAQTIKVTTAAQAAERCLDAVKKLKP